MHLWSGEGLMSRCAFDPITPSKSLFWTWLGSSKVLHPGDLAPDYGGPSNLET